MASDQRKALAMLRETHELILRITGDTKVRSEATLQADIRQLIVQGQFNLSEDDVRNVDLESPLGDGTRRRIDVEAGNVVIEVKRDVATAASLESAANQLSGYVIQRSSELGRRIVGIVTDGRNWHLYGLESVSGKLVRVAGLAVAQNDSDAEKLWNWLDGVLATAHGVIPTPREIERRLGSESIAHMLDSKLLSSIYDSARLIPEVQLKRELWARLLRTSFGSNFQDDEELFINHTLLVLTAELVAHAVVGFPLAEVAANPVAAVSGQAFAASQIHGVVEQDFFDWVVQAQGGSEFVAALARRLAQFDWSNVDHDVLKVIYESVINRETRHSLGEYYTPDWLAEKMVAEEVKDPVSQRVLDPACGSGTFLFAAIRHLLKACDEAGISNGHAVELATRRVIGVDVHPVAVTFARVTYLLAIGSERLRGPDRGELTIPVYLGDSVQWDQSTGVISSGEVRIPTSGTDLAEGASSMLFGDDLSFPESVVEDASAFDRLVVALADRAVTYRGGQTLPSIDSIVRRHAIPPRDEAVIRETFGTLCRLHADGRNHIWSYYVRNLVRPIWLSLIKNRVDVLIGNPPWLRYAAMTVNMQTRFNELAHARGLTTGNKGVSGRDLSALFVVRAVELYLVANGAFAFVMPRAALSRRPYAGFRSGRWSSQALGDLTVSFDTAWDMDGVKPDMFPVPSSVVRGTFTPGVAVAMPVSTLRCSGRLPGVDVPWSIAEPHLSFDVSGIDQVDQHELAAESPYKRRFRQGAVIAPRVLLTVEPTPAGPLGVGAGRRAVQSRRTRLEKEPWKSVPSIKGAIEAGFVRPLVTGDSVIPFGRVPAQSVVVPVLKEKLMTREQIDNYPGLAEWWDQAEAEWSKNRARESGSLVDRMDFHGQLSAQFGANAMKVVYTKAGNRLASALVDDPAAIVDFSLYWGAVQSVSEGMYLCTILNSETLRSRVEPLQARGLFGARHFDKYVFRMPIPIFDRLNPLHASLARLGSEAQVRVQELDLTESANFIAARKIVRVRLAEAGLAEAIELAVARVLAGE